MTTPKEVDYSKLSEAELNAIANGEQQPQTQQSAAAIQDVKHTAALPKLEPLVELHPALGAIAGGALGGAAAKPLTGYYASKAASDVGDIASSLKAGANIPNVTITGSPTPAPAAPTMTGGEKWGEKLTGAFVPGAQMDKEDLDIAKQMKRTVGRGGELAGGAIHEGILLGPKAAAENAKKIQREMELEARIRAAEQTMQQRAAAALERSAAEAAKPGVGARLAAAAVPKGAMGKLINIGMPAVSLAGAGAEGLDAWNRWHRGGARNKIQAAIGGLGAAGSAASMFPHPVTRIGGTALALGAPALNAAIDYVVPPEEQSGSVMPGVQPSGMGGSVMQGYDKGGSVLPAGQYMPSGAQADLAKRKAELVASGVPGVFKSAAKETYDNPIVNTALAAMPVTGDLMNAADVVSDVKEGNYGKAALGAGLGMLPFGGMIKKVPSHFILPAAENAARTQIAGTVPTYQKAAGMLGDIEGRIIDFGAGLGKGAEAMGSHLGRKIETYEPFAQHWTPDYSKASDVPSEAYGGLTNLNVLNVVPRETRDEIVKDIGRVIQPGGTGIITTRGKDVMTAQGRPGPEPMSMITSRDTYQKGFTKQELEDYLKYMLGSGYDISRLNLGPAGVMLRKK